jgi:hypothetical protein
MVARRQGYTHWNKAKKAGVVGDSVLWTDDPIYVDNTLGRVADSIGDAYPMDLAVAYTIASIGKEAKLTVDEMVNEHTKRAAILMEKKVGWGNLPSPENDSCGHDEIQGTKYQMLSPYVREGSLLFSNDTRWMRMPSNRENMTDECLQLARFRLPSTTSSGNHLNTRKTLLTKKFEPLLNFLKQEFEFHTMGSLDEQLFKLKSTKGECSWKDDDEQVCSHHTPEFENDWWIIIDENNQPQWIWRTGRDAAVSQGWNTDQIMHSDNPIIQAMYTGTSWNKTCAVPRKQVIRFNTIARKMVVAIKDKIVKKHIRKSIARIIKWTSYNSASSGHYQSLARSLLIVDMKEHERRGKHTTYQWKDWNWIEKIHSLAKYSNSKNRKIGEKACAKCFAEDYTDANGRHTCKDTCNEGWIYGKYDTENWYGHEISKFYWYPVAGNDGNKHWNVYAYDSWPTFNPVFNTLQEAGMARKLLKSSLIRSNAYKLNAEYDENNRSRVSLTEQDLKDGGLGIKSLKPRDDKWIVLPAEIHPEEYATTKDIFNGCVCGNPKFFDEYSEHFHRQGMIHITDGQYNNVNVKKPSIIEKIVEDKSEVIVDAAE